MINIEIVKNVYNVNYKIWILWKCIAVSVIGKKLIMLFIIVLLCNILDFVKFN